MFEWESEKDRLLKALKMSPRRKMEWLREMNEFSAKYMPSKSRKVRQKLREAEGVQRATCNVRRKKVEVRCIKKTPNITPRT
ncbi:MAG: hypothetical protein KAJ18_02915 [Candidatus Omnitrophica bacterium]|nr:hypothetical protein [Candidatus Omnitrophota bacterium]